MMRWLLRLRGPCRHNDEDLRRERLRMAEQTIELAEKVQVLAARLRRDAEDADRRLANGNHR